jgi:hypothetical protein
MFVTTEVKKQHNNGGSYDFCLGVISRQWVCDFERYHKTFKISWIVFDN